jgi:hypothetical protein
MAPIARVNASLGFFSTILAFRDQKHASVIDATTTVSRPLPMRREESRASGSNFRNTLGKTTAFGRDRSGMSAKRFIYSRKNTL